MTVPGQVIATMDAFKLNLLIGVLNTGMMKSHLFVVQKVFVVKDHVLIKAVHRIFIALI